MGYWKVHFTEKIKKGRGIEQNIFAIKHLPVSTLKYSITERKVIVHHYYEHQTKTVPIEILSQENHRPLY